MEKIGIIFICFLVSTFTYAEMSIDKHVVKLNKKKIHFPKDWVGIKNKNVLQDSLKDMLVFQNENFEKSHMIVSEFKKINNFKKNSLSKILKESCKAISKNYKKDKTKNNFAIKKNKHFKNDCTYSFVTKNKFQYQKQLYSRVGNHLYIHTFTFSAPKEFNKIKKLEGFFK